MNSQIISVASGIGSLAIGDTTTVSPFCLLGPQADEKISGFTDCKSAFLLGTGVFRVLHAAVSALESASLTKFEALVSDTACHNRALVICLIYKKFLQDPSFRQACLDVKTQAFTQMKALQLYASKAGASNTQVGQFFTKSCDEACSQVLGGPRIPKELVVLAQCVLLCQTRHFAKKSYDCMHCNAKVLAFQEQTEASKASCFFKSVASLSDIVTVSKKALAMACVEHVISETALFDPSLSGILTKGIRQINGRDEIPCFYAIEALYTLSLKHELPILLKVKKQEHLVEESPDTPFDVKCLYKPARDGFVPALVSVDDASKPIIVIEGMRSGAGVHCESVDAYTKRFMQVSLLELIQLNAAQHPQYSDKGFVIASLDQKEVVRLQDLALKAEIMGCSNKNQSLFCITHIFADTIQNQCGALSSATSGGAQ